jgi:archaetidylinositol phosphate synthase
MKKFHTPTRQYISLISYYEKQLVGLLVPLFPKRIKPHYFTMLGFIGMCLGAVSYLFTDSYTWMLFIASFGIFLNWFGDIMDGSVARYRKITTNFGFYQDHMIDGFSIFFLCLGITLSGISSTYMWLIVGLLYVLMELHALQKAFVLGYFSVTMGAVGATEGRLFIIFLNFIVFLFPNLRFAIAGYSLQLFDLIAMLGVIVFSMYLTIDFIRSYKTIYSLERHILQ